MRITHTVEIHDSMEKIWKRLRSFEGVEHYFPIVTSSNTSGHGKGARRTYELGLGNQIFQIKETIRELDDISHSITTSLDDGPMQVKGMSFTYLLKSKGEKISNLTMYTYVINPDAQFMAKNFFEIIGQGLKKIHET